MMSPHLTKSLIALLVALSAASVFAQMAIPYGLPVNVDNAKKAAAAALAEARKNNWTMAVAIVDPSGNLAYYEKMDNTQLGSAMVAVDKARSAALFKRPTKAFQEVLAAGGDSVRILRLQGVLPTAGSMPLAAEGKIVAAMGVWGATSA